MNPQEPIDQKDDEEIEDMGIFILSDECDAIESTISFCKYGLGCLIIGAIGFIIIS